MSNPIAYLALGVNLTDWDELESLPWSPFYSSSDKPDFEDWVATLAELREPTRTSNQSFDDWFAVPENAASMKEYWRQKKEALETCPIAPFVHNDDEGFTMVAVTGSVTRTDWDQAKEPVMAVDEASIQAAREFCAQHGIPFDSPKWLLIAELGS